MDTRGVDTQAAEWVARRQSGEMNEADRAEFTAWLAAAASHKESYERVEGIWQSLDLVPGIETALPEADTTRLKPRTWLPLAWTGSAAAVAVLFVAVWFALPEAVETQRYASSTGETRQIALSDGSQITLRADSALVSTLSRDRRSVQLEYGGAYFSVARDEQRPFIVQTANTQLRVLGTEFDVLRGPKLIQVSVNHGKVELDDLSSRDAMTADRKLVLVAGEQVAASYAGTFGAKHAFDPQQTLAWRDGRLSYQDARLEDVISDVNRYRDVKIRIADEALGELSITASFRTQNSDQLLSGLEATEPVVVTRGAGEIVLSQKP